MESFPSLAWDQAHSLCWMSYNNPLHILMILHKYQSSCHLWWVAYTVRETRKSVAYLDLRMLDYEPLLECCTFCLTNKLPALHNQCMVLRESLCNTWYPYQDLKQVTYHWMCLLQWPSWLASTASLSTYHQQSLVQTTLCLQSYNDMALTLVVCSICVYDHQHLNLNRI